MASHFGKKVVDDSEDESEEAVVPFEPMVPLRRDGPDAPKLVFLIDFLDGYVIRQLMEIIKITLTSCPIYLTEDGISIQHGNGHTTTIFSCEMYQYNFLHYFLDRELCSYPGTEGSHYHLICPDINKLRDAIRPVARREGLRILQYKDDPFIYVQIYGGTKNADGSGHIVPLVHYEPVSYDLDDYRQQLDRPNCIISLSEFCGFCANISKIRGIRYVEFRSYLKGVWIIPIDTARMPVNDKKWGDCDDKVQIPIVIRGGPRILYRSAAGGGASFYSIRVSIDTIKSLSKMSNLSPNGILRFYAEKDKLLRLQTNINYYGPLTMYLREGDEI